MSNVIKLKGRVDAQRLVGKINLVPSENAGGPLQAKTVYPIHSEQSIAPDEDYYGLAVVKVLAVPKKPACEVSVKEGVDAVVETVANIGGTAVSVCEIVPSHYYYDSLLFPEIPADILAQYPYCWIWYDSGNGRYDLIFSTGIWYYTSAVMGGDKLYRTVSETSPVYKYNSETDAWEYLQDHSSYWYLGTYNSGRIQWTNFRVPEGSADATSTFKSVGSVRHTEKGEIINVYK